MEAGRRGGTQIHGLLFNSFSRDMGGKRRIKCLAKPRAPRTKRTNLYRRRRSCKICPLQIWPSQNSTDISYIGPGMTVVGKISSEGILNVLGRVEGELHASIVRISDGAQVEGTIAAQELSIGGRFKGTIQADRVTLTSSAVVEGEIHHCSLAIEENAWFAGVSRPKEVSASRATDSPSSIQLVPTDGNRQINGSLEKEVHADTATG